MFRWIAYLFISLLALSLLRNIIGMVMGALTGTGGDDERVKRAPSGPPSAPKNESLVKDPVCGTFVATSSQWKRSKDGETYFFCSEQCRNKFA